VENTASSTTSHRVFVYDGDQIVLEFDGTSAGDVSHRYLWGPAVDQILADEQVSTTSSAGNTIWPLSDHLNTARDLADYTSGSAPTATVLNHREYDSFGDLKGETN